MAESSKLKKFVFAGGFGSTTDWYSVNKLAMACEKFYFPVLNSAFGSLRYRQGVWRATRSVAHRMKSSSRLVI